LDCIRLGRVDLRGSLLGQRGELVPGDDALDLNGLDDSHKDGPFLQVWDQVTMAFRTDHAKAELPPASSGTPLLPENRLGGLDPLAGNPAGPLGEHGHELEHGPAVGGAVIPRCVEQVERDAHRLQGRVGIHEVPHAPKGPVEAHHDGVVAPAQVGQELLAALALGQGLLEGADGLVGD